MKGPVEAPSEESLRRRWAFFSLLERSQEGDQIILLRLWQQDEAVPDPAGLSPMQPDRRDQVRRPAVMEEKLSRPEAPEGRRPPPSAAGEPFDDPIVECPTHVVGQKV